MICVGRGSISHKVMQTIQENLIYTYILPYRIRKYFRE
jgi:hypothetical protein